jgi:3-deoxy-7-phosphoheptulonate synthase
MKFDGFYATVDDVRIKRTRALKPPAILIEELPLTGAIADNVIRWRQEIADIMHGRDDRLLVAVGPCSAHDPEAVVEYAERLAGVQKALGKNLLFVVRTYIEKHRTETGWKGLVNDPFLDGSCQINEGLRVARKLLIDLAKLGVPTAVKFSDVMLPQWVSDLISLGAVGAQMTGSQPHQELTSGLSMPVIVKSGPTGDVDVAIAAIKAARRQQSFLSVTKTALAAIVETAGNPDCCLMLRGSRTHAACDSLAVRRASDALLGAGIDTKVMVDASHGNSQFNHHRQPFVVHGIAEQVRKGAEPLVGIGMESFLVPGRQDRKEGVPLVYGQSITDECMGWSTTEELFGELAAAVEKRREVVAAKA